MWSSVSPAFLVSARKYSGCCGNDGILWARLRSPSKRDRSPSRDEGPAQRSGGKCAGPRAFSCFLLRGRHRAPRGQELGPRTTRPPTHRRAQNRGPSPTTAAATGKLQLRCSPVPGPSWCPVRLSGSPSPGAGGAVTGPLCPPVGPSASWLCRLRQTHLHGLKLCSCGGPPLQGPLFPSPVAPHPCSEAPGWLSHPRKMSPSWKLLEVGLEQTRLRRDLRKWGCDRLESLSPLWGLVGQSVFGLQNRLLTGVGREKQRPHPSLNTPIDVGAALLPRAWGVSDPSMWALQAPSCRVRPDPSWLCWMLRAPGPRRRWLAVRPRPGRSLWHRVVPLPSPSPEAPATLETRRHH